MQSLRGRNPQKYKPNHASTNSRVQEQWKCHHVSREGDAWNEQEIEKPDWTSTEFLNSRRVLKNSVNRHVDKIWMRQEKKQPESDKNKISLKNEAVQNFGITWDAQNWPANHEQIIVVKVAPPAMSQNIFMNATRHEKETEHHKTTNTNIVEKWGRPKCWHPLGMLKIGLNATNKLLS